SDLIAGGCSGSEAMLQPIRGMRTILGTMCDPHTGWVLMRSLKTLKVRMTASSQGAEQVAKFLAAHPNVASVWYLGFLPKAHPDREVFERQCRGPGLDLQLRSQRRRGSGVFRPQSAESD